MLLRLIRRLATAAAIAWCLLAFLATATTASGRSAWQAATGGLDACSLLTGADVQAATKRPVRPPAKSATANLASCAFDDPKDPTSKVVDLNVLVAANAADAKKALAIAKSNAADVQPVAGLGEDAYWDKYLRALRIVKGRYELDLVLDSEAGGLDAAKALAVKALSRLPA
jgi:hypothetical protein